MIFDGHCDVLYKLYQEPKLDFLHSDALDVNLSRLKSGGVHVQAFAIFVEDLDPAPRFAHIQAFIRIFHTRIHHHPEIVLIRNKKDLASVRSHKSALGALLTVEGASALSADMAYVPVLYHLGVRSLGLTWNNANWAGDGALARGKRGLTTPGRELVEICNKQGMIVDVSHLSEPSFWDCIACNKGPIYASHSNAYTICEHPRNLKDEQITALFRTGGTVGVTFVPQFLRSNGKANMADVLRHVEHLCGLGGEKQVAIGSDFDGVKHHVAGLEHAGCFPAFIEQLDKHYSSDQVNGFMHDNAYRFFMHALPDQAEICDA